jgi:HEAT repeat protein
MLLWWTLWQLQSDKLKTRIAAAKRLQQAPNPRSVVALIAALRTPHEALNDLVVEALVRIGPPAIVPLTAVLADSDVTVADHAAKALERLGAAAVEPLLAAFAAGPEPAQVRAGRALGGIGDLRAVPALLAAASSDDSTVAYRSDAAVAASNALERLGAAAVEPLLAAFAQGPEPVRREAGRALGGIGDPRAIPALLATLDTRDAEASSARWVSARALGRMKVKDAADVLLRIVSTEDEDPGVRAAAATSLGEIGDPRAVDVLLRIVGAAEEAPDVRAAAATSLGEIGDPRAVEALLPLLQHHDDEDTHIREAVVGALGNLGDQRAVEPLLPLLTEPDEYTRYSVIHALRELKDPRAVNALVELLDDNKPVMEGEEWDTRAWAVQALGELGDPQALKSLRALAQRTKPEDDFLRTMLAEAFRELGCEEDADAISESWMTQSERASLPSVPLDSILRRLRSDDLPDQITAVQDLQQSPYHEAVQALIEGLRSPHEALNDLIVEALIQLGTPTIAHLIVALADSEQTMADHAEQALVKFGASAVEPLLGALASGPMPVQMRAAAALGAIKDRRAAPGLLVALANDDLDGSAVRSMAARALGEMEEPNAVDPLVRILENEEEEFELREDAANTLGKIGDLRAVDALLRIVSSQEEYSGVQSAAAEALGKIGDPRAVDALLPLLRHDAPWVRRSVAAALGDLGDRRALEPLLLLVEDADEWTRESAVFALGKLRDPRVLGVLVSLLEHEDRQTRGTAVVTLGELDDPGALEPLRKFARQVDLEDSSLQYTLRETFKKLGRKDEGDRLMAEWTERRIAADRPVSQVHVFFDGAGSQQLLEDVLQTLHPTLAQTPAVKRVWHDVRGGWPSDAFAFALTRLIAGGFVPSTLSAKAIAERLSEQNGRIHGRRFYLLLVR